MPSTKQRADFYKVLNTARECNILHPEVITSQWALESGWGKHVSGTYNYFGIKAKPSEPATLVATHEFINGKRKKIKARFRNFSSLEEALIERSKFTRRGGRYDKAGYFDAKSPYEAIVSLKKGGYATDPHYVIMLVNILKSVGIDPYKKYPPKPTPTHTPINQPIYDLSKYKVPQASINNKEQKCPIKRESKIKTFISILAEWIKMTFITR